MNMKHSAAHLLMIIAYIVSALAALAVLAAMLNILTR